MKHIHLFLSFLLIFSTNLVIAQGPVPTFGNTGEITICVNGSYFLNPSTTNGTFSTLSSTIATVNASGYVTGVSRGSTIITLAVTGAGTVTATVTVAVNANPSLSITDPLAQPSYKFSNNPQGPNGGLNNYVGYNGYSYSSQARSINTGFFRASNQLGDAAGCPYEYYIFRCTTCGAVPEYATRPQGTFVGNSIQSGSNGQLTYTSTSGVGPFTIVYLPSGGSNITLTGASSPVVIPLEAFTNSKSYTLISVTDQSTKASTDFSGTIATVSVVPPPTASLTGSSQTICAGTNATLNLITTGTGAIAVTLSNGSIVNTVSGTTTISVTPTINTTYTIASVTDVSGNGTTSGSDIITLYNSVTPVISLQPTASVTINEGTYSTLSVTATNATAYQWYKDGVAITSANSYAYNTVNTLSAVGTYYVTITGTCNFVSSINAVVNVNPRPQGSLSGSTISIGETGKLTYTDSHGGGPFAIVYQPDGGSIVTVNNISSGVAFNVAITPTTITTYSLVSVIDQTTTSSRTIGFITSTATITVTLPVGHYVGESFGGGKVAYILVSGDPGYDASVQHGLIAANVDQSTGIRWYNGISYTSTLATGTAIGTGLANTTAIISSQNNFGSYAAKLCADYAITVDGVLYTGWYLPSLNELNKLYLNKVAIGGFANNRYWSSSELDLEYAYSPDLTDGIQWYQSKNNIYQVRAIRSF